MSERTDADALAERLLNDASYDPDDDLRMLARQLLRRRDEITQLSSTCQRIAESCDRQDEETKRLCESPDVLSIATALADSVRDAMLPLANYDFFIDGTGVKHSVHVVMDEIDTSLRATFKDITGREYNPEVRRQMDWSKHRNILAARLLEAIMTPDDKGKP